MHKRLFIPDPDIELWQADLDISSSEEVKASQYLSIDERERANRFQFSKDRKHFIAARAFLRQLLGEYLDVSPSNLTFGYSGYGKPYIPGHETLAFNLSHSGGKAICGIRSTGMIGVDLEKTDRKIDLELIVRHFFAAKEIEALFKLPESERVRGFFRCWTRKEAFIKAKGDGLSLALDQFEVSLDSEGSAELLATHYHPSDVGQWRMKSFSLGKHYVGAVVVSK
ncbi:MAG: 4'-phosphopantetheinyl transferase superfamily protein [Bacteroidota bacterium]